MKFQITENFGNGSFGYHYIECEPVKEKVCRAAREKVIESFQQNNALSLLGVKPSRPTLKIVQYDIERKRKVRGGIEYKTKWR